MLEEFLKVEAPMKICLIQNEKLGQSIRLEKQSRTLLKLGNEMALICGSDQKILTEKFCGEIPVYGVVRPKFWIINKILTQLYKLFYIDIWAFAYIYRVIKCFRPQVVIIRDFDLVGTLLALSKLVQFKVIYDVNDLRSYRVKSLEAMYPNYWFNNLRKYVNAPFAGVSRIQRLELKYFKKVDSIIVANNYKERLMGMGIPTSKITLLPNYEDFEWWQSVPRDPMILNKYKNKFKISYIGSFGWHRGVDILVRSMSLVVQFIPEARLVIVGPVTHFEDEQKRSLDKLIAEIDVSKSVEITGNVPNNAVLSYLDASDVCVIPFRDTIHTNNILGHKLFMYMASGKPLIATNLRLQAEVIGQIDCGLVIKPNDPKSLADAIIRLYNDPQLRYRLGENGRKAVEQQYNWKRGSQEFEILLKNLERNSKRIMS